MRVLVADDCGAIAPTAIVFLAYWGHEVEVAHDGVEALRKARAWRPDVVLSRVRLERMDGLSLLAALRAGGGLSGTCFVLVGAEEDGPTRTRAAQLGGAGFLLEPLAVAELARLFNRLGKARAARAASGAGGLAAPARRRSAG